MEAPSYWEEGVSPDFLLSVNDRMLQVREKLLEAAATRIPVFLCGEKGLGKDALAYNLHRWSPRAAAAFVRVSCAVVPQSDAADELFGRADDGLAPLLRARGGTLYVSGVDRLEPAVVSRFASTVARLESEGADHAPRLVFSIENPLSPDAERRLPASVLNAANGIVLSLPPLRERPEDIGLLSQHLLQLYSPLYSSRIKQVRSSLVDLFKQYPWPGNVRELERVIRRFLVLEDESAIRRELEEKIWNGNGRNGGESGGEEFPAGLKLQEIGKLAAQRAEAHAIRRALERTRWNKKAAAVELGVSYKSLLNKIRDYGLDS